MDNKAGKTKETVGITSEVGKENGTEGNRTVGVHSDVGKGNKPMGKRKDAQPTKTTE